MFNLVCVHPFGRYEKGQIVTDQGEIAELIANDREHQFVKIAAPEVEETTPAVTAPAGPDSVVDVAASSSKKSTLSSS